MKSMHGGSLENIRISVAVKHVVIIASVSDLRRKDLGNTVSVLGPVNIAEDL